MQRRPSVLAQSAQRRELKRFFLFFLVVAAAARGLDPSALFALPSVQRMVSRVWIVKLRAKLPPAQVGKLFAQSFTPLAQAANGFENRVALLLPGQHRNIRLWPLNWCICTS